MLVSAFRSPYGASAEIVRLALKEAFEIAASPPVFLEYEDVLQRPEQRLAHRRTIEQVNAFLAVLSRHTIAVDIYFQWKPQLPDQDDEMLMEAAINGRVDAIITHNLKHFSEVAPSFGIRVLTPLQFLREVRL